jgi:hypothetical protein
MSDETSFATIIGQSSGLLTTSGMVILSLLNVWLGHNVFRYVVLNGQDIERIMELLNSSTFMIKNIPLKLHTRVANTNLIIQGYELLQANKRFKKHIKPGRMPFDNFIKISKESSIKYNIGFAHIFYIAFMLIFLYLWTRWTMSVIVLIRKHLINNFDVINNYDDIFANKSSSFWKYSLYITIVPMILIIGFTILKYTSELLNKSSSKIHFIYLGAILFAIIGYCISTFAFEFNISAKEDTCDSKDKQDRHDKLCGFEYSVSSANDIVIIYLLFMLILDPFVKNVSCNIKAAMVIVPLYAFISSTYFNYYLMSDMNIFHNDSLLTDDTMLSKGLYYILLILFTCCIFGPSGFYTYKYLPDDYEPYKLYIAICIVLLFLGYGAIIWKIHSKYNTEDNKTYYKRSVMWQYIISLIILITIGYKNGKDHINVKDAMLIHIKK